jgi:hypothetical protein
MGYFFIELLQFYFCKFVVDKSQSNISLLDHVEQILLGLEEGQQFLLVLRLLVLGQFLLDLCVDLADVCLLLADEDLDLVAGLLQLHLHDVHALDLSLDGFVLRLLGHLRLAFFVQTDTHKIELLPTIQSK